MATTVGLSPVIEGEGAGVAPRTCGGHDPYQKRAVRLRRKRQNKTAEASALRTEPRERTSANRKGRNAEASFGEDVAGASLPTGRQAPALQRVRGEAR